MSQTVIMIENTLDPEEWQETQTDNVCEFLKLYFNGRWPDSARLYYGQVATECDITPYDEEGVKLLQGLKDKPIYCVVYPEGGVAIFIAAVIIAAIVVAVVMKPAIPNNALRNQQTASPNNELSTRTNSPRVKGRIPDIFGTVRSTPDLISSVYSTFINNQEVENSVMCIGRGAYDVTDIRDGTTLVSSIAGTTVQVYAPFANISSGEPYIRIGTDITNAPRKVTKSNSVNGQVLRPPNVNNYIGTGDVYFQYPDSIKIDTIQEVNMQDFFEVGDQLAVSQSSFYSTTVSMTGLVTPLTSSTFRFPMPVGGVPGVAGDKITLERATFSVRNPISGAVIAVYNLSGTYTIASVTTQVVGGTTFAVVALSSPATVNPEWSKVPLYDLPSPVAIILTLVGGNKAFDLDGTYTVLGVTSKTITISNPVVVNPGWNFVNGMVGNRTPNASPLLQVGGPKWIGPFSMTATDSTEILINLYASSGIYKDNGKKQYSYKVDVEIEITPANALGVPIGAPVLYARTIAGSRYNRDSVGLTAAITQGFTGPSLVRVRRTSATDLAFEGTVVDEVKWRDLYSSAPFKSNTFGNVTVVRSRTYATSGALTLKERKLNMQVTRKLPLWQGGTSFTSTLYATNDAAEILSAILLDPKIGNRTVAEVDFASIYATRDKAISYFGNTKAFEFCYTFDSDNMSAEESIVALAASVYSQAYRRGNIFKLMFKGSDPDSVLLFNHRNKVPGSETRTQSFGYQKDNDGVEYTWTSPVDDVPLVITLPSNGSAKNPLKVENIGVRNGLQAYFHALRYWNRVRYGNQTVEFEATQEAHLLVLEQRILVADNTRPNTQDGDIVEQDGLLLTCSRVIKSEPGKTYTIYLQLYDGSVEAIPVTSINQREVLLSRAPRLTLVSAFDSAARTTFIVVANDSTRQDAFLVTEKEPVDNYTCKVTAVNYDERYWQNDKDYINGVVDQNGNTI